MSFIQCDEINCEIKKGEDGIKPLNCSNVFLNRVQSGHTRARAHLKNIKIEAENTK
jgi:hypothetical protein